MRRLSTVLFFSLFISLCSFAQTYIREGDSKYSAPLYNWDGKHVRQGDSKYSAPLYNFDGKYIRQGESKYSNPIINIEGKIPTAVLIVLMM